eukprot:TRINITY_DN4238_c0_g1_i2.p1 TRINITY_DN4238_c0_g1~~TRINITY_DN4238_c0_g1_i2.p1  ORF type:complete len:455 (+),score=83.15 TRINITY_DN4238_c0_g1_i2:43-1407(+)
MGLFSKSSKDSFLGSDFKRKLANVPVSSIDPVYGKLSHQNIPIQMHVIFEYLDFVATRVPEIFLRDVPAGELRKLQNKLDRNSDNISGVIIGTKDPYIIGALLVSQLRQYLEMRNAVCDDIPQEDWSLATTSDEKQEIIENYQRCVSALSVVNQAILRRVCSLLKSLDLEAEITKLTTSKLAVIFTPVLFSGNRAQQKETINGLEKLIKNQSYVFKKMTKDQTTIIESRSGTMYSGTQGSVRRYRVDSNVSGRSFRDASVRSLPPSQMNLSNTGLGLLTIEEENDGAHSNIPQSEGHGTPSRRRNYTNTTRSPMTPEKGKQGGSIYQSAKHTDHKQNVNAQHDELQQALFDALVHQYQIFCYEKRMELESDLTQSVYEEFSSKKADYEEIKEQLQALEVAGTEESIATMTHEIEMEAYTLQQTMAATAEMEATIKELEAELTALSKQNRTYATH